MSIQLSRGRHFQSCCLRMGGGGAAQEMKKPIGQAFGLHAEAGIKTLVLEDKNYFVKNSRCTPSSEGLCSSTAKPWNSFFHKQASALDITLFRRSDDFMDQACRAPRCMTCSASFTGETNLVLWFGLSTDVICQKCSRRSLVRNLSLRTPTHFGGDLSALPHHNCVLSGPFSGEWVFL